MAVHVSLAFDDKDPLLEKKKALLLSQGLSLTQNIDGSSDEQSWQNLVSVARIIELTEDELYFFYDEAHKEVISPRNEIQALDLILNSSDVLEKERNSNEIKELLEKAETELNSFSAGVSVSATDYGNVCTGGGDVALQDWAKGRGIISKIRPAEFEGTGRGAQCVEEIKRGDIVLEIPQNLIISTRAIFASDKGFMLQNLEGIDDDTKLLIWTIFERENPSSDFAPFFSSLPKSFHTGLSLRSEALEELIGTPLLDEIMTFREIIRNQYKSILLLLHDVFSENFPKKNFTWENYLYSIELFYAYGIKIIFPDEILRTCLAPVASLLNHSIFPHITAFSRIDSESKNLKLKTLRKCEKGVQMFLSYGPLSNSRLLQDYGFAVEDNPYDFIPLSFELPEDDLAARKKILLDKFSIDLSNQMIKKITKTGKLSDYLMGALRILVMEAEDLDAFNGNALLETVNRENEFLGLNSLKNCVETLLEEVPLTPTMEEREESGDGIDAEIVMARTYREGYREILLSVLENCKISMHDLEE